MHIKRYGTILTRIHTIQNISLSVQFCTCCSTISKDNTLTEYINVRTYKFSNCTKIEKYFEARTYVANSNIILKKYKKIDRLYNEQYVPQPLKNSTSVIRKSKENISQTALPYFMWMIMPDGWSRLQTLGA